ARPPRPRLRRRPAAVVVAPGHGLPRPEPPGAVAGDRPACGPAAGDPAAAAGAAAHRRPDRRPPRPGRYDPPHAGPPVRAPGAVDLSVGRGRRDPHFGPRLDRRTRLQAQEAGLVRVPRLLRPGGPGAG